MQCILLAALLGSASAADTVVVCPEALRSALDPWMQHRTAQGHNIVVVPTSRDARTVHNRIRQVARGGRLRAIVLVGDASPIHRQPDNTRPGNTESDGTEPLSVPTHYVPARINILWGSEPEIATDNPYADLDGDQLPDVAIGRLTADTPSELSVIVQKIIDYENCLDFGVWRRRVNFVAGIGGFGAMADRALEVGAKALITRGVPAPYTTTMTYGSWRSPYCPDPREFHRCLLDRLNEGCLFWVYIGHGHVGQLDRVRAGGGEYPIFDLRDVTKLECNHGLPIAFFMACYTGAFDASIDCLAEEMLHRAGAPVAVIAGSRVTMPYGMAVFGMELLDAHFYRPSETLGDILLHAKRRMAGDDAQNEYRPALDLLAKALSPVKADLSGERLEHVQLFNLLGDPLLRLPKPRMIDVRSASSAQAGEPLNVHGRSDVDGRATIELTVRRDRLRFKPPVRRVDSTENDAFAQYDDVYRRANDSSYVRVQTTVAEGRFDAVLEVPSDAKGQCQVRVFVEGTNGFALGSAEVQVVAPKAVPLANEPHGTNIAKRRAPATANLKKR